MNVRNAMTGNPACCTQDTSLRAVAGLMIEYDCGEIPVVDDADCRRPIGVITDRDIAVRAVAQGVAPDTGRVGDYMTTPCITVSPDDALADCCALMERHQIRRILVVDGERLCGIVSLADIAKHAEKAQTGTVVKEVSEPV